MLCEHIVCGFENVVDTIQFFSDIHRQRQSPFWKEQQLVLRPEHRELTTMTLDANESAYGSDNDPNEQLFDEIDEELQSFQDIEEEDE